MSRCSICKQEIDMNNLDSWETHEFRGKKNIYHVVCWNKKFKGMIREFEKYG